MHIVKNPRQNHTSVAQFVKNARESDTFWGGGHRLELSRYIFIDRRVILDYVKRDAAHFCRYLRDPRLRKKRRGAFLSLFTVLQSIMTEIPAIFVVIYATFASMTRDARHFCRYLRDSSLRKKRHGSFLSLFA